MQSQTKSLQSLGVEGGAGLELTHSASSTINFQ